MKKSEVEGEMKYINPIKNYTEIKKNESENKQKKRSTRKDKKHNIKFPVDSVTQMKLRSYFREAKRISSKKITQTQFNTSLLQFGINHQHLINWELKYIDTKVYMHTNIHEIIYENEIGGPHGLAIRKHMSERKVVYHIVTSILLWIEREGSLDEILQ